MKYSNVRHVLDNFLSFFIDYISMIDQSDDIIMTSRQYTTYTIQQHVLVKFKGFYII